MFRSVRIFLTIFSTDPIGHHMQSLQICSVPYLMTLSPGYILSFLRLREAVQTSILSKRWRFSWTLVSKLEFIAADLIPWHLKHNALDNHHYEQLPVFFNVKHLEIRLGYNSWKHVPYLLQQLPNLKTFVLELGS